MTIPLLNIVCGCSTFVVDAIGLTDLMQTGASVDFLKDESNGQQYVQNIKTQDLKNGNRKIPAVIWCFIDFGVEIFNSPSHPSVVSVYCCISRLRL